VERAKTSDREQAELCNRMSAYVGSCDGLGDTTQSKIFDDAESRLAEAAARAKTGDVEGALREYEEIARLAEREIERAALVQAQATLSAAALLLDRDRGNADPLG
jgi:hypothetical protein